MAFDNHYQWIEPLVVTWPSDGCRDIGLIWSAAWFFPREMQTPFPARISGSYSYYVALESKYIYVSWIMYISKCAKIQTKRNQSRPPAFDNWITISLLWTSSIILTQCSVHCSVWADTCIIHVSHHSSVLLFWRCPHGQSLSWFRLRWLSSAARF